MIHHQAVLDCSQELAVRGGRFRVNLSLMGQTGFGTAGAAAASSPPPPPPPDPPPAPLILSPSFHAPSNLSRGPPARISGLLPLSQTPFLSTAGGSLSPPRPPSPFRRSFSPSQFQLSNHPRVFAMLKVKLLISLSTPQRTKKSKNHPPELGQRSG